MKMGALALLEPNYNIREVLEVRLKSQITFCAGPSRPTSSNPDKPFSFPQGGGGGGVGGRRKKLTVLVPGRVLLGGLQANGCASPIRRERGGFGPHSDPPSVNETAIVPIKAWA